MASSKVPETKGTSEKNKTVGAAEKNQARASMNQEVAHEMSVNLKKGCSGSPTACENGGKRSN